VTLATKCIVRSLFCKCVLKSCPEKDEAQQKEQRREVLWQDENIMMLGGRTFFHRKALPCSNETFPKTKKTQTSPQRTIVSLEAEKLFSR
jgi:hypothetical protein